VLSAGERHECKFFEQVMEGGQIPRQGPGRPKQRPARVAGDKGYSYPEVRSWCSEHKVEDVIPTRKDQERDEDFDKKAYKLRNLVERLFNRLKQNRRIATRYEKRARCFRAFLILAAIRLWL
jgi:transposase